jgi:dienelactone hydrolase
MDRIAEAFADAGFAFVKFNFSHSGATVALPEEFADPEAYGLNSYTKELHDLETVLNWVSNPANSFATDFDATRIGLVGHSRGGGIALLKAGEDSRVKAVTTWASVAECKTPWGGWSDEKLQEWKDTGVEYITNGRTGQILPLYYTLHEDFLQNRERLDIEKAVRSLQIPMLIVHGTADTSVPVKKARLLASWNPEAETFFPDTDHVFGRRHPWTEIYFPEATNAVVARTIEFFRRAFRL